MVFLDAADHTKTLLEIPASEHVSMECTLVKTEVFTHINEPWFQSNELLPSDVRFCHNVMAEGYKICAHPGVICGQVDMKTGKSHWPSETMLKRTNTTEV